MVRNLPTLFFARIARLAAIASSEGTSLAAARVTSACERRGRRARAAEGRAPPRIVAEARALLLEGLEESRRFFIVDDAFAAVAEAASAAIGAAIGDAMGAAKWCVACSVLSLRRGVWFGRGCGAARN
jgi:hypothetical protein